MTVALEHNASIIKNRLKIRLRESKKVSCYTFITSLFLNLLIINDLVRMLFSKTGSSIAIVQYISYGFVLVFSTILLLTFYSKRIIQRVIVCSFVWLAFFFVSSLLLKELIPLAVYYLPIFFSRLFPAFVLGLMMDGVSARKLFVALEKYRLLWFVYSTVAIFYISRVSAAWGQYASNFGFNMLLPCCLSFYNILTISPGQEAKDKTVLKRNITNRIKWIAYFSFFLIAIVLRGSRTALLCVLLFILSLFFFTKAFSKKTKIIVLSVVALSIIVFLIAYKPIANLMISLFPSSRTVALLFQDLTFDSGRNEITNIFLDAIKSHPFSINGLFSDRYYYTSIANVQFDMSNYPHNFFIEVFYHYGVAVGFFLLLAFALLAIQSFLRIKKHALLKHTLCFFFFFLFASGVLRLLFSGSYATTTEFFFFIGLSMKLNMLLKPKRNSHYFR